MEPDLPCAADPDCPRVGKATRNGNCWWHDLNGFPRAAEHAERLRGSYRPARPLGW